MIRIDRRLRTAAVLSLAALAAAWPATGLAATANGQSPNFAGYEVGVAPHTATITFKLPALTCTPAQAGMVPGVVFTNFTTNEFTSGGAYSNCNGGVPGYAAIAEINDTFSFFSPTMSAGDTIKVTVTVSATKTSVTIADKTTGGTVKDVVSGPGGGGSFTGVSIGQSKVGSPNLPVPQFTKVVYSSISVNGVALGTLNPLFPTDMYNGATLQVNTSVLNGTGNGFTTTFDHT